MVDDGIVQVIASDAHDSLHRTPQMDELIHYLEQRYTSMEIKNVAVGKSEQDIKRKSDDPVKIK